ncbi:MAG: hypothetical protein LBM78_02390 [Clostridiales bacterium]|jgi:lysine decarboxylase|nr:hypothetical protein [Clostridiales bacterium]
MTLLEWLHGFSAEEHTLFCTPGHKGTLHPYDVTELSRRGVAAEDAVKESERRAARCYGADGDSLRFLYNGATEGIFAMLSAFAGKRVFLPQRAAHKCVYAACEIFGIDLAFEKSGGFDAVFVTSPDYYGNVTVEATGDLRQKYGGKPVLVDAAHGAHFAFYGGFPASATVYADACVLSAHKTLPALTQSAYLVCKTEAIRASADRWLALTRTTSPSYLLAASLEHAAAYAKENGEERYGTLKRAVEKHLPLREKNDDFTRVAVRAAALGYESGAALSEALKAVGVYCELADRDRTVFILSVTDDETAVLRLADALARVKCAPLPVAPPRDVPPPARVCTFLEATRARAERVPLKCACGRIAAREIGLSPPCLPLAVRGEALTAAVLDTLSQNPRSTFGVYNGEVEVLTKK